MVVAILHYTDLHLEKEMYINNVYVKNLKLKFIQFTIYLILVYSFKYHIEKDDIDLMANLVTTQPS